MYTEDHTAAHGLTSNSEAVEAFLYCTFSSPDPTLAILANKLYSVEQGASASYEGVTAVDTVTRARGLGFLCRYRPNTTGHYGRMGFYSTATDDRYSTYTAMGQEGMIGPSTQGLELITAPGFTTSAGEGLYTMTGSTYYGIAVVLGGMDASRYGWDGSSSGYNNGAMFFIKEVSGEWKILWRAYRPDETTLRVGMSNYNGSVAGTPSNRWDWASCPKASLDAVLTPTEFDRFTDTNGTALTSHTPDVGSTWTAVAGVLEVQSNQAVLLSTGTASGVTGAFAVQTSDDSDVYLEFDGRTASDDLNNYDYATVVCRWDTATDTGWTVRLHRSASAQLYEHDGSSRTQRATTSITTSNNTDMRFSVRAEGSTIEVIIERITALYAKRIISYASATRNQTSVKHGFGWERLGTPTANGYCRHWSIFPLGTGGEWSALDAYEVAALP